MGWLTRIFNSDKNTSKSSSIQKTQYQQNLDIVDGVKFVATLKILTPINILIHHDEQFSGSPEQAPVYGSPTDGLWISNVKSEFSIPGIRSQHQSDIGLVEPQKYHKFLMDFREIIEGSLTHNEKLSKLKDLSKKSSDYKEYWKKLCEKYENFPVCVFYLPFTILPGVGKELAKRLYENNFHSLEQIINSNIQSLIKIRGLSKSKAELILSTTNLTKN